MDFFLKGEGRLKPADAAVAIITVDAKRYLMQLRDQKPGIFYPGHWGLFGGTIDEGEDPVETLSRELEEELELKLWQDAATLRISRSIMVAMAAYLAGSMN